MKRILIVEEEQEDIQFFLKLLESQLYSLQNVKDPDVALHRLRAWKPDLVILSLDQVRSTDFNLVQKVRAVTPGEYVSLILVTSKNSLEMLENGFLSGADDILFKPLDALHVTRSVKSMLKAKEVHDALRRANHRIEELTSMDELTGILNIKAAYRRGEEEVARSRKLRKFISCFLVNLDNFCSVNQNYGFIAGNQILQEVARRIQEFIGTTHIIARLGADEFMIILRDLDLSASQKIAEGIRKLIQSVPFKRDNQIVKLTATIGVAGLTPDQSNQKMGDLFQAASESLRSAKANGANRVEVYLSN